MQYSQLVVCRLSQLYSTYNMVPCSFGINGSDCQYVDGAVLLGALDHKNSIHFLKAENILEIHQTYPPHMLANKLPHL